MKPSDLLPKRIIDQNSQTIREIAKETGYSYPRAAQLVQTLMGEKRLERVCKQVGDRILPSYRERKK